MIDRLPRRGSAVMAACTAAIGNACVIEFGSAEGLGVVTGITAQVGGDVYHRLDGVAAREPLAQRVTADAGLRRALEDTVHVAGLASLGHMHAGQRIASLQVVELTRGGLGDRPAGWKTPAAMRRAIPGRPRRSAKKSILVFSCSSPPVCDGRSLIAGPATEMAAGAQHWQSTAPRCSTSDRGANPISPLQLSSRSA